jgi:hypothetical protein
MGRPVIVRGSASGFAQEIIVGAIVWRADEPEAQGGTDTVHHTLTSAINTGSRLV